MGTPSAKKRDGDHIDATSSFEYGVLAYSYIEYQILVLLYNVLMQYKNLAAKMFHMCKVVLQYFIFLKKFF